VLLILYFSAMAFWFILDSLKSKKWLMTSFMSEHYQNFHNGLLFFYILLNSLMLNLLFPYSWNYLGYVFWDAFDMIKKRALKDCSIFNDLNIKINKIA
jgi:hypothetical protein